jgi:hypothetical protein
MAFVQLIEFGTDDIEKMRAVNEHWRESTEGKRTASRQLVARDRDHPGRFCSMIFFDSYEAAMRNSELPETQEAAEQYQALADSPPTFHNLEILDERTLER